MEMNANSKHETMVLSENEKLVTLAYQEIQKAEKRVHKLQQDLAQEGAKINNKLAEYNLRIHKTKQDYAEEMRKAKANGKPTARLERIAQSVYKQTELFVDLRTRGTQRYVNIKQMLQQENMKLRNLKIKFQHIREPFQR